MLFLEISIYFLINDELLALSENVNNIEKYCDNGNNNKKFQIKKKMTLEASCT